MDVVWVVVILAARAEIGVVDPDFLKVRLTPLQLLVDVIYLATVRECNQSNGTVFDILFSFGHVDSSFLYSIVTHDSAGRHRAEGCSLIFSTAPESIWQVQ